jgi:hypothetical protein
VTCHGRNQFPTFDSSDFQFDDSRTTENVEALTPLPHVTLELDPESVYVAGVCVDNVPAARRPPLVLDLIVALVGRLSRDCQKGGKYISTFAI